MNGNDANNCKSSSAPCKTLAHVSALITNDCAATNTNPCVLGESVGLAANSVFNDDSLFIGIDTWHINNSVVGVYGTGAAPVIDGSKPIPSGAWTKTPGRTNVYQANITTACQGAKHPIFNGNVWVNLWDGAPDGAPATYDQYGLVKMGDHFYQDDSLSVADVDSNPGYYYWSDNHNGNVGGSGTIYVRTFDNSNPATNGKTYWYADQCSPMLFIGDNPVVNGPVVLQRGAYFNGGIVTQLGTGGTISDVTSLDGVLYNAMLQPGTTANNLTLLGLNANLPQYGSGIEVNVYTPTTGPGVTFNNLVENAITGDEMGAIASWVQCDGAPCGPMVFNNSTFRNIGHIDAWAASGLVINGGSWVGNNVDSSAVMAGGAAKNLTMSNFTACMTNPSGSVVSATATSNVTISNSTLISGTYPDTVLNVTSGSVTITNSVLSVSNSATSSLATGKGVTLTETSATIGKVMACPIQ